MALLAIIPRKALQRGAYLAPILSTFRHFSTSSTSDPPSATGPLTGYRVLDLGQVVAGNFCGALLAYFGADVIKVEPPGRGDAIRHLRSLDESGTSLWWRSIGRNRRCITVDLHKEHGREIIRQLAAKSDVLVENFRPGVMEKWKLGPKDLGSHLVYARISGYGQTGPKASLPGYASVCEGYGGFRYVNGYPDRAPVRPNISLGDSMAGLHAAFGAVMALLQREAGRSASGGANGGGGGGGVDGSVTNNDIKNGAKNNCEAVNKGLGQVVDAAISESMFNMLEGCVSEYFASGEVRPPSGSSITGVVPSGCWKASDGVYVLIGGNGNSVYNRLMEAVGRPDMGIENPKYATDALRWTHESDIFDVLNEWVASHTSQQVMDALDKARVPAGPIMSIADIANEPQYNARGMFHRASPPSGGQEVTVPAMLPVMGGTPGTTRWAGPELGEHTDEVLIEELGMGVEEIAALREIQAI